MLFSVVFHAMVGKNEQRSLSSIMMFTPLSVTTRATIIHYGTRQLVQSS